MDHGDPLWSMELDAEPLQLWSTTATVVWSYRDRASDWELEVGGSYFERVYRR